MSSTVQISLDNARENQLAEVIDYRTDLPRSMSEAVRVLLFEYLERMLTEKKELESKLEAKKK